MEKIGARAIVYDTKTVQRLRDELGDYDVIVNVFCGMYFGLIG